MPESASLQLKQTTTSVLFQPKPFAAGVWQPLIVGLTLSILTSMRVRLLDVAGLVDRPEGDLVLAVQAVAERVACTSCAAPPSTL